MSRTSAMNPVFDYSDAALRQLAQLARRAEAEQEREDAQTSPQQAKGDAFQARGGSLHRLGVRKFRS